MPDTCPVCGERDLVKPAQPETAADTSAAVLTLVVVTDLAFTTGGQFETTAVEANLTRPLNLLHCVWTC
jgi:hypothetical protein